MEEKTVETIVITEEDFDRAIMTIMTKSLRDLHFEGHLGAAMAYSMGGAAFAKDVKNILFGKEENHE